MPGIFRLLFKASTRCYDQEEKNAGGNNLDPVQISYPSQQAPRIWSHSNGFIPSSCRDTLMRWGVEGACSFTWPDFGSRRRCGCETECLNPHEVHFGRSDLLSALEFLLGQLTEAASQHGALYLINSSFFSVGKSHYICYILLVSHSLASPTKAIRRRLRSL